MTAPPFEIDSITPIIKDYSLIEQRIEEILCPLDPRDFQTIDLMLGEITGKSLQLDYIT